MVSNVIHFVWNSQNRGIDNANTQIMVKVVTLSRKLKSILGGTKKRKQVNTDSTKVTFPKMNIKWRNNLTNVFSGWSSYSKYGAIASPQRDQRSGRYIPWEISFHGLHELEWMWSWHPTHSNQTTWCRKMFFFSLLVG